MLHSSPCVDASAHVKDTNAQDECSDGKSRHNVACPQLLCSLLPLIELYLADEVHLFRGERLFRRVYPGGNASAGLLRCLVGHDWRCRVENLTRGCFPGSRGGPLYFKRYAASGWRRFAGGRSPIGELRDLRNGTFGATSKSSPAGRLEVPTGRRWVVHEVKTRGINAISWRKLLYHIYLFIYILHRQTKRVFCCNYSC